MKKMLRPIFVKLACLTLTILVYFWYFNPFTGTPMKLIHPKTRIVVVEFENGKALFHNRFLEREMKLRGIAIPPALRKEYGNKAFITLQDPLFQKAFKEIYYPMYFANHEWEPSS